MKNCQICGAQVPDDAVQCPVCGAMMTVNQNQPVGDDNPTVLIEGTTGYVPPMDSSFERKESEGLQLKSDVQGAAPAGAGQQPYGGQVQQPYGAQPQQPYGAQPQQPYGPQMQQPYGQGDMYAQDNAYYPQQGMAMTEVKKKKTNMIAIIIVAVVAVAIIGFAVWFFFLRGGKNSPEGVVKGVLEALDAGDYDEMMDYFPDFVIGSDSDSILSSFETMESMGIEIEISDIDIYDTEYLSKSEISDLEEDIEYYYDEKVDVDDACIVYATFTTTASMWGETQSEETDTDFTVIEIDGDWYIYE